MIPPLRTVIDKLRSELPGTRNRRVRRRRSAKLNTSPGVVHTEKLEERLLLAAVFRDAAKRLTNSSRSFDEFPGVKAVKPNGGGDGNWALSTDSATGNRVIASKDVVIDSGNAHFVAPKGITADVVTNEYSINDGVVYLRNSRNQGGPYLLTVPNAPFQHAGQTFNGLRLRSTKFTTEIIRFTDVSAKRLTELFEATPELRHNGVRIERSVDTEISGTRPAGRPWGNAATQSFVITFAEAHWDLYPGNVTASYGVMRDVHVPGRGFTDFREYAVTPATYLRLTTVGKAKGKGLTISGITHPDTIPLVNIPGFRVETIGAGQFAVRQLRGSLSTPAVDGQFEPTSAFNVKEVHVQGSRRSAGLRVSDVGSEYVLSANRDSRGSTRPITAFTQAGLRYALSPGERFLLKSKDTVHDKLFFESKADNVEVTAHFEGGSINARILRDGTTPAVRIDVEGAGTVTPSSRIEFISATIGGIRFKSGSSVSLSNLPARLAAFTKPTDQLICQTAGCNSSQAAALLDAEAKTIFTYPGGNSNTTKFTIVPAGQHKSPTDLVITTPESSPPANDLLQIKFTGVRSDGTREVFLQSGGDLTTAGLPAARGASKIFPLNTKSEFRSYEFEFRDTKGFGESTGAIGGLALRHEVQESQLSLRNAVITGPERIGQVSTDDLQLTQQNLSVGAIHSAIDVSMRTSSGKRKIATLQSTLGQRNNNIELTLSDFANRLQDSLRALVIAGTNLPAGIGHLSAARREQIAKRITVQTRLQLNSNPPALLLVRNSPVDVVLSILGRERPKSYNGVVASPVRLTIPNADFKFSNGELNPISDIAVDKVEIGRTTVNPQGKYVTTFEELKQQGSALKLAFFPRNVYDSNRLLLVPGNSFGLYGDKVPFDIPAVQGVTLGSTGTTADLGNSTHPGLIVTNGEFRSLSTPMPSVTVDGRLFASRTVKSAGGLRLTRFPELGINERSYAVTGGAVTKNAGSLIKTDLSVVFGAADSTGLVLFPDSDSYKMGAAVIGQMLLGNGILAQSAGTRIERDSTGKFVLVGGAFLDLNAAGAHVEAEINNGTAKARGQLVRGRFSLDYANSLPPNDLSGTILNWFTSDPAVKDRKHQAINLLGYSLSARQLSQNPLRLTIGSNNETFQGSFSMEAGGGVLTGVIEPATLTSGKLPSSPLKLNLGSVVGEPSGFLVKGILMENGGTVPLAETMKLMFRKSSFDGTTLSEGPAGAEPNMVEVKGRHLKRATIKSTTQRTVGDLVFDTLDGSLDLKSTPTAWRFRGPATYFGTKLNVGIRPTNPQMTIGGSAGQQLRVTGLPGLQTQPSFPAPAVIRVAGLTFDVSKLTEKGVSVSTSTSKTYTYTSSDYKVMFGGTELSLSLEVTFKVSNSGVEVQAFSGTLKQNTEFKIGNAAIQVTSLTVKYDAGNRQLEISGDAKFSFMSAGANAEATIKLGDQNTPGLVIKDGVVESFKASVTGSLDLMKLSIQATNLTVVYNKMNSQFSIYGDVTVSTQSQSGIKVLDNLNVKLGNEKSPGIVIEGGSLKQFDFAITGDINLFKMTASPKDLRVRYSRGDNQLQITGELSVTLTPGMTVTAGLPGDGLLINTSTGKVEVRGLSLKADSNFKFGVLTIKGLAVEYEENSNGDVSISAAAEIELPSGLTVGGSFKIVNGKLDSIGIVFEKNPGILVAKGLINIYRIDVKVEGLSDLNNFKITGEVSATVGPMVKFAGKSFAYANIVGTIEITQTSLALKGTAEYVGGLYGSGQFEGKLDWSGTTTVTFNGSAELYRGLIKGNISARIDANGNVDFRGGMEVAVPRGIPAIGGKSLGQLNVELRIRPAEAPSASYARFSIRVGLGPVTVSGSVKLDFGGQVDFRFGGSIHIPLPWPLPDINISLSFSGSFKLFDGTRPVVEVMAANGVAGSPHGEIVYNVQAPLPASTTIDLYADHDNMNNDGRLIASGIPYQQGSQTFEWKDMSTFAAPGEPIYVYAVVNDGENAAVYSDYSSKFEVTPGFTPTLTTPPAVKTEFGDAIEFSAAQSRAIVVGDPRSSTDPDSRLEVILLAGKGILDFPTVPADVTYDGHGTSQLIITGTAANITKALDGLIYSPDPFGDVEPDAIEVSVRALPQEMAPAVTGRIDITFDSLGLFFDGSNAGLNVGGDELGLEPIEVVAGEFGQTPLDLIEVQSYRTEFLTGALVKINNFEMGKEFLELPMNAAFETGIHATFSAKRGILTLTGEGRLEDYERALSEIIYDTKSTGSKSLEVSLIDHSGAKNKLTVPINVLPGVTLPKLDVGLSGSIFVEGDPPAPLAAAATIDVPDGETIQSVRFDFDAESYVAGEDVLSFDVVAFNNDTGSNLTSQFDTTTGALILAGTASEQNWNAAIQDVRYNSLGGTDTVPLSEGQRYVTVTVTDGSNNAVARHVVIDVTSALHVNNPPELTLATDMITLGAHEEMKHLDPQLTLTSEAPKLIEAKVSIVDGYMQGDYELAVSTSWPNLTTEWDAMAGVLSIYGVATTWEYEDMLRSVEIIALAGRRTPGAMSLTFSVNDGLSTTETDPFNIDVETAPFLQADLDNITPYTKGRERVRINDGFWIDTDDQLDQATVSISSGYRKGDDELVYDPSVLAGTLISGDFNPDTGVLTLSGLATALDYEEAFRGVYYRNTRHNPVAGDRVIEYQVVSSVAGSNVLNAFITVTPVIMPPTVTIGQTSTFTEDGAAVPLLPNIDITTMDDTSPFGAAQPMLYGADVEIKNWIADEDELTFTESAGITVDYDNTSGRLVLGGAASFDDYETVLKSVMYRNRSHVPTTTDREISIRVLESGANGLANQTMGSLAITAVPDAVSQTAGTIDPVTVMSNTNAIAMGLDDVQYEAPATVDNLELYFQATTLPDELLGRVQQADGSAITKNTVYPLGILTGLQFEPASGGMGTGTFEYKVVVGDPSTGNVETDGTTQSVAITVEGVETNSASEAFMAQAYRDLLHSNPDRTTLTSLTGQLDQALKKVGRLNGPVDDAAARREVVDSLIAGTDYRTAEIRSLYQQLVGRTPTADELAVTTELAMLRREMLASNEFFLQNNSDGFTSYIPVVYRALLNREPTQSEQLLGEQQLEAGVRLADFIASLNAPDLPEVQRQALFHDLLGRAATFDDMFEFDGSTRETLLSSILGSDEYYIRYATPSTSSRIRTRTATGFEAVGIVGGITGGSATGTLIAPQYVLVAAHSVADLPPGQIRFTLGGTSQHIEKRYVHPDYDRNAAGSDAANDIAILKLAQPVSGVTPAVLTGVSPKLGDVLNLVGYGQHGGALFGTKREGSTPPVSSVEPTVFHWQQHSALQNDADPGDSGAPLFATINGNSEVIGIVSGGTGVVNEIGDTGTNTRVDAYLTWIQGITGDLGVSDAADAPSLKLQRHSIVLDVNAGETRIPFSVSSTEDVTFSISSNRPSLFASLEVDHDGGVDGQLVFKSARNMQGTAEITVEASNSAGSATETFHLEIQFADGVPTLTSPDGTISNPRQKFDWTSVANAARYEIEITPADDVLNPLVQQSVTATHWQPDFDLPLGDYVVRVRSFDASNQPGNWSGVQDISVATPVSIDAIPSRLTERRPTITWKAVAGAANYEVWLNNVTTGEARVIHQTGITGNSLQIATDLDGGLHQLWIRAFDSNQNPASWSVVTSFNVIPAALNSGLSTFDRKPELRWTGLTGFSSYEIFIRSKAGDLVETGISDMSWTPPNDLSDGPQRWWIRGVAANGRKGAWSDAATLDIGGRPVVETSGTTNDATPEIRWSTVDDASRYEVYLAKSDGTLVYRNDRLPNASVTTPALADGDYAVWARAYDASGKSGPWSRRANVTIAAATASLSTSPTRTIDLTVRARPEFQWTAAAGAASYQVSLRHENGAAMNVTSLTGTSWTPSVPLAAGLWQWAVRAIDGSGDAGSWSQLSTIQVGGRTTIESVTGATSGQPTTFRWNGIDGADRFILHVETESGDVVIRENNLIGTSFTSDGPLASGGYRMWVKVVSSDNSSLGYWSREVVFHVAASAAVESEEFIDEALHQLAMAGFQPH